ALAAERRALLNLLSRCAINEDQALRFYDRTMRKEAGINLSDAELLSNPYLLFEGDRGSAEATPFEAVDRGMFPDESVRREYPIPEPSGIAEPTDARRVRALVVDLLEDAAVEGHTLLPQSWLIRRARERALDPLCPLGEDVLAATEPTLAPLVGRVATRKQEISYQLDRLIECREI